MYRLNAQSSRWRVSDIILDTLLPHPEKVKVLHLEDYILTKDDGGMGVEFVKSAV